MLWLAISRSHTAANSVPPLPPLLGAALCDLRRLNSAVAAPSTEALAQAQSDIHTALIQLQGLADTLAAIATLKRRLGSGP